MIRTGLTTLEIFFGWSTISGSRCPGRLLALATALEERK